MTKPRDPDHKATFSHGVRCNCSCGWQSGTWYGDGAHRNATGEWEYHKREAHQQEAERAAA